MMHHQKKQYIAGFALLLTLVVVSVVLAIGLSLLDITLKQLVLSGVGRDSEVAFHAAYAGAECGQYWRLKKGDELLAGAAPELDECLKNTSVDDGTYSSPVANVHLAQYSITWGSDSDRCTEIDLYLYDARSLTDPDVLSYDISYYGDAAETCPAGNVCTILFSRGYNRACNDIVSIRTIQREIVLQY